MVVDWVSLWVELEVVVPEGDTVYSLLVVVCDAEEVVDLVGLSLELVLPPPPPIHPAATTLNRTKNTTRKAAVFLIAFTPASFLPLTFKVLSLTLVQFRGTIGVFLHHRVNIAFGSGTGLKGVGDL